MHGTLGLRYGKLAAITRGEAPPARCTEDIIADRALGHLDAAATRDAARERGNSLLKTTFKALGNGSLCPWTISRITAAALVVLHIEHGRTT